MAGGDAGEGPLDPLRQSPFGGLKYLASIDDGTWSTLLTPGASGYGLIVWSMAKSCSNCGDYVSQWLLPGLVKWVSVISPVTHKTDEDLWKAFGETTYRYPPGQWKDGVQVPIPWGPMVGISDLWVPEEYECTHMSETGANNLDLADNDCDGECDGVWMGSGYLIGLAPVLAVIPIDAEFFASWHHRLEKAWSSYSDVFENYGHCACMLDSYMDDDTCMVAQIEQEYGTLAWNDEKLRADMYSAEANCGCPWHGFTQHWWEMVSQLPDFVDEVGDDLFADTWAYALDRYFTGWRWLEQHTPQYRNDVTERNEWLISYSRRFSPYWGASGLPEYLTAHGIMQYAA